MPLSVVKLAGHPLPLAGGGFWRATPRLAIRLAASRIEREGRSFVMYLHPHEFDPEPLHSHNGFARNLYVNLGRVSIADKLRYMFKRFAFVPVSSVVAGVGSIPERLISYLGGH